MMLTPKRLVIPVHVSEPPRNDGRWLYSGPKALRTKSRVIYGGKVSLSKRILVTDCAICAEDTKDSLLYVSGILA